MRFARSIFILAAGGAILAPLCVFGHGAEFLSAKLTLLPEAEVLLEITADYGGNPLIADEAIAQEALIDPVRLRRGESLVPLAELSAASITQHDNWAEFAPASYLPSDAETQAHTLITAAWRWRSSEPEIVFEMPKGKLHDVLLWTRDQTNPDAPPKWMLLLAGDRSKAIAIHWPPWWQRWQTVMASSVVVLALGYFVSRNFTLRQRTL
ncbi:hypothetical protein [Prosthecobacter sp.]